MDERTRESVEEIAKKTVAEFDKGRFVFRKTTWLIAGAAMTTLGATVCLGSSFFTREHMQRQLRQVRDELAETRSGRQVLERRLVEVKTELELQGEP